MLHVRVHRITNLREGEARVFSFPTDYGDMQGFVIRHSGGVCAYENKCRHWPVPLDYGNADFYVASLDRIRCKHHGAEFDPGTGECDAGPCKGDTLTRFDLEIEGDDAVVIVP
jgi:nitrite reductase/ring-hydroxylating ferredoxin subunit